MSEIPADLRYRDSHEWVRVEDDIAVVGISDHAQDAMGDLVFVELPEEGVVFAAGDEAGRRACQKGTRRRLGVDPFCTQSSASKIIFEIHGICSIWQLWEYPCSTSFCGTVT